MNANELYDLKRLRQECHALTIAYDELAQAMLSTTEIVPSMAIVGDLNTAIDRLRERLASLARDVAQERRAIVSQVMSENARKARR